MKRKLHNIGVLTSGGDAPGMNACIRAVVRACIFYGLGVTGIRHGYQGLIEDDMMSMGGRSVSNIIHRGGTVLKSARSEAFKTAEGMESAFENVKRNNIHALVVIGGDGTLRGANEFYQRYQVPVIGIPGTIDNDLMGTDHTIGYDTATNTAVEAIDKIRDTASSHSRLFFIEVMGRDAGFIAIQSAIAAGAEAVLIPENKMSIDEICRTLELGARKNKSSSLVVVAEGGASGSAMDIAKKVNEKFSYYDTKVTILGHLQRGGSPTTFDRVLASRMGIAAVEGLMNGKENRMVGLQNNKIVYPLMEEVANGNREMNDELLRVANILSV